MISSCFPIFSPDFFQLCNLQLERVRDFGVLGPKWNVYQTPLFQGQGSIGKSCRKIVGARGGGWLHGSHLPGIIGLMHTWQTMTACTDLLKFTKLKRSSQLLPCWERANQFSSGAPLGASTLQGRPARENYQYKMDPMLCVCTCVYVYMFVCISMYINMDMYVPWHVCESERKTRGNQFLDCEGPRD